MHFGIVVSDPNDWTAQALHSAFAGRGVEVSFMNFSDLAATITEGFSLASSGVDLLELDGLIVRDVGRQGAEDVGFRFEALCHLERLGIKVINPTNAIARAANKFATSLALKQAGVPTPATVVTTSKVAASRALSDFGKAVSKPLFGYKGKGIMLLKKGDENSLQDIIKKQGMIYLQEFIESGSPRDIRAFVVGNEVVGAIYRVAPQGQWISNLARGGSAKLCTVTDELKDLATRASMAVGTFYSGVDLLETGDGLKVIEVNGTPSGKGIFDACGINAAEIIADRALLPKASKRLST
ncbi:MAG: RimK family alpha-L-glutamate ligase [Methanotrichaceae archaeon]